MKSIWDAVSRFFGPSNNERFAAQLADLANTAVACGEHFRKTTGHDLPGIVAFERKGDDIVSEIHELLDNSFILRFDIPDAMRLTDDLDNVIDGMRQVAIHIDIYKRIIADLPSDAVRLVEVGQEMMVLVRDLVRMLAEPRLSLPKVREVAKAVDAKESEADGLVAAAERSLVASYSAPNKNRLEFIAWAKLYQLLEEITDDANHCARQILSLARKEA